eukprot:TRINITY_DN180_c0_g1_i1.p1 TRINITY_DN180_c0_g1~~TRINITY_DN180_c0_g1_i1.p1  ORF type:complete len:499 (+),score=53.76 TRINITY_DN180_c0_g1_i1:82-1578(+)
MCIRDRYQRRVHGEFFSENKNMQPNYTNSPCPVNTHGLPRSNSFRTITYHRLPRQPSMQIANGTNQYQINMTPKNRVTTQTYFSTAQLRDNKKVVQSVYASGNNSFQNQSSARVLDTSSNPIQVTLQKTQSNKDIINTKRILQPHSNNILHLDDLKEPREPFVELVTGNNSTRHKVVKALDINLFEKENNTEVITSELNLPPKLPDTPGIYIRKVNTYANLTTNLPLNHLVKQDSSYLNPCDQFYNTPGKIALIQNDRTFDESIALERPKPSSETIKITSRLSLNQKISESLQRNSREGIQRNSHRIRRNDGITGNVIETSIPKSLVSPFVKSLLKVTRALNYNTEASYSGSMKGGVAHGKGTMKYTNGDVYVGEWFAGRRCGYGVLTRADGMTIYEGEWSDDVYHGYGHLRFHNGVDSFESFSLNAHDIGALKPYYKDYQGEFADGNFEGVGTIVFLQGERFMGQFTKGKATGKGSFQLLNTMILGEWKDDLLMSTV